MKCDLHCHTSYSFDCLFPPKAMVDAAIKKGIDCLAITDHGQIQGSLEAIDYVQNKPILIIPGIEIRSKEGDILGLNVKTIIPDRLSAKETIKKIKAAGGMAIIPHPFSWFGGFKGDLKNLIQDIDGIEVLNASVFGPGNKRAQEFSQKYQLSWTCGSDAHSPNLIGRAYLKVSGNNLSAERILKEIRQKNAKIRGKEANFFEKVIDHSKRNIAKIKNYS